MASVHQHVRERARDEQHVWENHEDVRFVAGRKIESRCRDEKAYCDLARAGRCEPLGDGVSHDRFSHLPSRAAETNDEAQAPACKTAEVNPVTGHVMCIDPLGAAVEAPPEDIAPPCDADQSRGQWSWAPNCRPKGS